MTLNHAPRPIFLLLLKCSLVFMRDCCCTLWSLTRFLLLFWYLFYFSCYGKHSLSQAYGCFSCYIGSAVYNSHIDVLLFALFLFLQSWYSGLWKNTRIKKIESFGRLFWYNYLQTWEENDTVMYGGYSAKTETNTASLFFSLWYSFGGWE